MPRGRNGKVKKWEDKQREKHAARNDDGPVALGVAGHVGGVDVTMTMTRVTTKTSSKDQGQAGKGQEGSGEDEAPPDVLGMHVGALEFTLNEEGRWTAKACLKKGGSGKGKGGVSVAVPAAATAASTSTATKGTATGAGAAAGDPELKIRSCGPLSMSGLKDSKMQMKLVRVLVDGKPVSEAELKKKQDKFEKRKLICKCDHSTHPTTCPIKKKGLKPKKKRHPFADLGAITIGDTKYPTITEEDVDKACDAVFADNLVQEGLSRRVNMEIELMLRELVEKEAEAHLLRHDFFKSRYNLEHDINTQYGIYDSDEEEVFCAKHANCRKAKHRCHNHQH